MRKPKKDKSQKRAYSYAEYVHTYYPKNWEVPKPFTEPDSSQRPDPRLVGTTLATESIEKAKRELAKRH